MRRLAATIFTLVLIAMFLWTASPVYAGQASVTADCENWYVTIQTLGSRPGDWTATLDGQPVEDGTYTIPDSVNETRTFTVVWTRGDRQDVKTYTGERNLNCGTGISTTTTYLPTTTNPTSTTVPVQTTFTSTSSTGTQLTSSTSASPSITLPYTGMNPMTTLGVAGVLFVLAGLVWAIADSRREE